ncbi:MAG: hypothetical protein AAFY72_18500 [Cyanobacteria bacterium J06649_4]
MLDQLIEIVPKVDSVLVLVALVVVVLLTALTVILIKPGGVKSLADSVLGEKIRGTELVPVIRLVILCVTFLLAFLLVIFVYQIHAVPEPVPVTTDSLCQGETCWRKDPTDNECHLDARTVTSTVTNYPEFGEQYKGARLEMRYSDFCNASWVKGLVPVGFHAYILTESGEKFGNSVKLDNGFYTDMGPGKQRRQACVEKPDGSDKQCTSMID